MTVGESGGRSGAKRGEDRNDPSHSRVACDLNQTYRLKIKVKYLSKHSNLRNCTVSCEQRSGVQGSERSRSEVSSGMSASVQNPHIIKFELLKRMQEYNKFEILVNQKNHNYLGP